jgi:hypothetical protein
MRIPLVVSIAAVVVGLTPTSAAPGELASPRPTGFPLVWRGVQDALVGLRETATLRRIHGVWEMRSDKGGLKAYLYLAYREPLRGRSKAAECGGIRYPGAVVRDTKTGAGEGWLGLVGDLDATGHLRIERRIAVYKATQGPPACVEARGRIDGMTGALTGFNGTFVFRDDATLVLRSG